MDLEVFIPHEITFKLN